MTVNYVRHLNGFYQRVLKDTRLSPNHISLYNALFQLWNRCRFQNPFPVVRAEVLDFCRIGSPNTYVRCLKDLHEFGYIEYMPSKQVGKPSVIGMRTWGLSHINNDPQPCSENDTTHVSKPAHAAVSFLSPSNKHISKQKKEGAHARIFSAPALEEVNAFFEASMFPREEAEKFFYYYQANGWLQGGKTPIRNWQAAANKWVRNIQPPKSYTYGNKRTTPGTGHPFTNKGKDYSEPL